MVIKFTGIKDLSVAVKQQIRMYVKEQFLDEIDAKDEGIEVIFTPKHMVPCVKFTGEQATDVCATIAKYVNGYDDDGTYVYSPFCSFGVLTNGDTKSQLAEMDSVHETIDADEIENQRERVDGLFNGNTFTVVA